MKFKFIQENREKHSVEKMCAVLDVSTSGYYAYIKRADQEETEKQRQDREIAERIHFHFIDNMGCYGSPRIHFLLRQEGYKVSERTVGKRMRQFGLKASSALFKTPTTDSDHDRPVYDNHLDRQFDVQRPNQVWITDITYIYTDEGFLYLNPIIDLCGRRVITHRIYDHLKTELCLNTLREAITIREPAPGLIHHSDRGAQYCSKSYTEELRRIGAVISMSRRATPHDNACMESFFATLKKEFVYHQRFKTKEEAILAINAYIDYYNTRRLHSTLGYMSPIEFEMSHTLSQTERLS